MSRGATTITIAHVTFSMAYVVVVVRSRLASMDQSLEDAAIDLACRALWEAADADSATGGPDPLRGIYPIIATITAEGFTRVEDAELAERYERIAAILRENVPQ